MSVFCVSFASINVFCVSFACINVFCVRFAIVLHHARHFELSTYGFEPCKYRFDGLIGRLNDKRTLTTQKLK